MSDSSGNKQDTAEALHKTFEDIGLFQEWDHRYYYPEALRFYDEAFDFIVGALRIKPGERILDAGCGPGRHSMALARKGIRCLAIDCSESILEEAKKGTSTAALDGMIEFKLEDITCLRFPDQSFEYVLCWGVLMHVPNIEKAVEELLRVMKPGGRIAISLSNPLSLECLALRVLRWLRATGQRTRRDQSPWMQSPNGPIYVRGVPPQAFAHMLARKGMRLINLRAGQFAEYKARSALLRKAVSVFNEIWFRHVQSPALASGYMVIGEKPSR
ncbi:MAG: class I SAM-dependent methyltransferase [Nitrospiraceae bacterium]